MDAKDYDMVPVANFASRFLNKFGYVEGRGIGKEPKGEIPVYFNDKTRATRQGLGVDRQGGKKRKRIGVGTKVTVTNGLHRGLTGFVLKAEDDYVLLEVPHSTQTFKIPASDIEMFTENEAVDKPKKSSVKPLTWVLPGLQVRVTSKKAHDGRLYNCKVPVHDVLDEFSFSILGPDSRLYDDLKESQIQTTIPSLSHPVKILKEPHRGAVARLMMRNRKENLVSVQLVEEPFEVLELSQDEVCAVSESSLG